MMFERNLSQPHSLSYTLELIAVLGLWLVACSVDKIPGFQDAMDCI